MKLFFGTKKCATCFALGYLDKTKNYPINHKILKIRKIIEKCGR